jgi:hypothetical protein
MDKENERFADQLLDASLAHYAEEPRPGMEERILANVRATGRAQRSRLWTWGLAVSAAVFVLAVIIQAPRRRPVPVSSAPPVAANHAERSGAVVTPKAHEPHRTATQLRSVSLRRTRPERFPTPAPLSEQEKLLLRYVKETPRSVPTAEGEPTITKDLEIAPLTVAALEIKDLR